MKKTPSILPALVAAFLACGSGIAQAADAYPAKPVKVVIGYTPGGPADSIARLLFADLSRRMGQSFIVENRAGASGSVAAEYVAKSPADGYTLFFATTSISTVPTLYKRPEMEPSRFMKPVACSAEIPFLMLSAATLPARNIEELDKLIKSQPGKHFMGTSGNGGSDHLTGVMVAKELGWVSEPVPYKGNAAVLTDLAAGNVSYMFAGSIQSALPLVKDGRIRAMAVTSTRRSSLLPDVPTLNESVLKGLNTATWVALMAPYETPAALITQLNARMNEVLSDPAMREKLQQQGAEPMVQTPAECGAFIQREYVRWRDVIQNYKVSAD